MTAIFAVLWSTGRTLSPGEVWRIKKTSPPCRLKRSSHAGWQFRYRRPDTRSRRTYSRSCGAVRQRITYSSACQLIIWTVKRTRQEKKKKKKKWRETKQQTEIIQAKEIKTKKIKLTKKINQASEVDYHFDLTPPNYASVRRPETNRKRKGKGQPRKSSPTSRVAGLRRILVRWISSPWMS